MSEKALTKKADPEVSPAKRQFLRQPAIAIHETDAAIQLQVDMPGVSQDGMSITVHENVLTLHGRVDDDGLDGFAIQTMEYQPGDFERSFTLPASIDADGITANVKHGVVGVTLPKATAARPKRIAVTGS